MSGKEAQIIALAAKKAAGIREIGRSKRSFAGIKIIISFIANKSAGNESQFDGQIGAIEQRCRDRLIKNFHIFECVTKLQFARFAETLLDLQERGEATRIKIDILPATIEEDQQWIDRQP